MITMAKRKQTCSVCGETGHNSRKHATRRHIDGWANTITGMGVVGRDKRLGGEFFADDVSDEQAIELWRGDDLAARIIEEPVSDMLRGGWDLQVSDGSDTPQEIAQVWRDLDVRDRFRTAMEYERAFGGAAIIVGVNDSSDPREPVDLNRVLTVDWLTTLEPRELTAQSWYVDTSHPKFGLPEIYQITPIAAGSNSRGEVPIPVQSIHESRMIVFPGIRVSRRQLNVRTGWGDSVLTRLFGVLRDFKMAFAGSALLLSDFSQAVMKMKGLAELIAEDNSGLLLKRMQGIQQSRSVANAVLIDESEEFTRQQTSLAGYPEMIDRWMARLASAVGMPVTRLFGISAAGLNATGENDMRQYHDKVASLQTEILDPRLSYLTELIFAATGNEPDEWSIKFRPLWQPSDLETAQARKLQAETDQKYIDVQVLSPEDVAKSRFGGDEYSFETTVDLQAMESQREANEAAEAERMRLQAEALAGNNLDPNDVTQDRKDVIEKRGNEYCVLSKEGDVLGCHPTRKAALRQLRAVEARSDE